MPRLHVTGLRDWAPLFSWAYVGHRVKGLDRVRHNTDSSYTPPLLEVPKALGSFPNEVPGRTLPN